MATKLTKRIVEEARYGGDGRQRCVVWDTQIRGLGLRITPNGRKTYVLSYRTKTGVKRLSTIGRQDILTVDQARSAARSQLVQIELAGADPVLQKAQRKLEARTATVHAMVDTYIVARRMRRPDSAYWYLSKYITPTFGIRHWSDVRRAEIREWHARIESPYNANRALQVFKAAFTWRILNEDGGVSCIKDARNPCAGVALRPEKPRQVRLELADWPILDASIEQEANPYLRGLFRFLLTTGCRKREALTLRREDVRLVAPASVVFRDTKNGTDRKVPLSNAAVELLRQLPRVVGNPFVFCGEGRAPIGNPAKSWDRIRERANMTHLRIHDLRRSVGSWLGDVGSTSKQIGDLLGHKSDITSRVYMALGEESKRRSVEMLEALRANVATSA